MSIENDTPLACIQYLASSRYRIPVLQRLAEGEATREELQEATGASRVTVSRILSNYRTQHLVTRNGRRYALTRLGEYVTDAFTDLYEKIDTAQSLQPVWEWFPADEFGVELSRFGDADIVHVNDPFEVMQAFVDRIEASAVVNVFPVHLRNVQETIRTVNEKRNQRTQIILTTELLETVRADPELSEALSAAIWKESTEIYCHGGSVPNYTFGIADDCAFLHLFDKEQIPRAHIECPDEEVCEWATTRFERYRREGTSVNSHDGELLIGK